MTTSILTQHRLTVQRTLNPAVKGMPDKILNAALGISGEAGEVTELVKKWRFHDHELKSSEIKDELGDLLWYIQLMATTLGLTMEEIFRGNIDKLQARYGDTFTVEASHHN